MMSTTDQGDVYENKVFLLVKKLIADGSVALENTIPYIRKNLIQLILGQIISLLIFL